MRPAPFLYERPAGLDAALAALAEGGARVLAGGQSLVPLLNQRLVEVERLVDIMWIEELEGIAELPSGVEIGAGVRQAEAERSTAVLAHAPLLVEALAHVAYPEIRNAGTVCGALAFADPIAELPVVALVLGAELLIAGPGGRRAIAAADFYLGPMRTALRPDELLLGVRLPDLAPGSGSCFMELSPRRGAPKGEFPVVGVAAVVTLGAGLLRRIAIAYLGVDQVPRRAEPAAERLALGRAPDPEALAAVAAAAAAALEPPTDIHADGAYRRRAAEVLTRRALGLAAARAAAPDPEA